MVCRNESSKFSLGSKFFTFFTSHATEASDSGCVIGIQDCTFLCRHQYSIDAETWTSFKDDRASAKPGQFSPQRFDNGLGKDAPVSSRYPSPSHPTYGSSPFSGQNGTFDVTSMVEKELSLGLRGMAVEDDHISSQYRQPSVPSQLNGVSHSVSPQVRPTHMVQSRTAYGGYPQADYTSYYTNGAPRESYMDYGYGYNTPADPSLYPAAGGINSNSPANVYPGVSPQTLHPNISAAQQSGLYYDYSASARSPSQYYYPTHQAMIYPTISPMSPLPTPQLASAVPTGMQDKKQV